MGIESWVDGILHHRTEMHPVETHVEPRLQQLPGMKAVVFDIYGTLVISGSGDVGSADTVGRDSFVRQTLVEAGLLGKLVSVPNADSLQQKIQQLNRERCDSSCPKPEVDIVEVWRQVLAEHGWLASPPEIEMVVKLATRYEALANPTWPMPNAADVLRQLKQAKFSMGIVSNAQIFTPCLVNNLLGEAHLAGGGFDLDLCVFSNRYRQAKPGPRLFEVLRFGLSSCGILPNEALYVGNDMLNDIWAAAQAGLRTAWFAGDQRSCRPRQDDTRCQGVTPDLVLTNLMQLPECLLIR
ncbi:MAG: HAD family hydrolase [Rubripirellula sp.]